MTAAPFFHVGFLVKDLDSATERFGDVFGVSWTKRTTTHSTFWEPGVGTVALELDVTYSVEGPPHIELLQATGDGLYSARRGEGFHHIGGWSTNLPMDEGGPGDPPLERIAAQFNGAGELIVSHFSPDQLHGVMLEVITEGRREMMRDWLDGGPFVD
jgi:catechol 2,3-dioxygenase-like lactoylglutathione lyase family enzyme